MKTIELHTGEYEITLLTKKEYEAHKKQIPLVNDWWWLRFPGHYSNIAAYVKRGGSVDEAGYIVSYGRGAVRHALKSAILNLPIGEKFIALGNRWIMIDDEFAISEDVITHRRYDSKSNVWETSELKEWLEDWAKKGETSKR